MNTEELMKLADAYANAAQGYNMATLNKARAALEAALSAKDVNSTHTLERLVRIMGTFDLATGHADTFDDVLDALESELRDVLGYYRGALSAKQGEHERISELEAQVEQLQVQLAGCGAAALQNTEKSRALRAVKGDYGYSESYAEVCRAVDREIDLREQNAQLLEALKHIEELSVCKWSAGIARATIAAVKGKV